MAARARSVRQVEALLMLSWDGWRGRSMLPALVTRDHAPSSRVVLTPLHVPGGMCAEAPPALVEHVLATYLPRKLANYCGWAAAPSATSVVRVPPRHAVQHFFIKSCCCTKSR